MLVRKKIVLDVIENKISYYRYNYYPEDANPIINALELIIYELGGRPRSEK